MTSIEKFLDRLKENTWEVLKDRTSNRLKTWLTTSRYLIRRKGIRSIWSTNLASTTRSTSWNTWKTEITTFKRMQKYTRILSTWLILIWGASGMIDIYSILMRGIFHLQFWSMMMTATISTAKNQVPKIRIKSNKFYHHYRALLASKIKRCSKWRRIKAWTRDSSNNSWCKVILVKMTTAVYIHQKSLPRNPWSAKECSSSKTHHHLTLMIQPFSHLSKN